MGTMARANKTLTKAVAYLRTSSAANVGADKDSEKRQRAAIEAFAKAAGFEIVDSYAAVQGPRPSAHPAGDRGRTGQGRVRDRQGQALRGSRHCEDDRSLTLNTWGLWVVPSRP
jgi:hypothetical protein